MHRQYTIEELRSALRASFASMTPNEHFYDMVKRGIVNEKGEVTRLIGGPAEPEPYSKRPKLMGD